MEKICKLCQRPFMSSKYRPQAQEICSDPVCQHTKHLENMKRWRRANPHYFKQDELRGAHWRELYRRRIRRWRKAHPEYFKKYRDKYKDRHREYMREYMRRYRHLRKRALMQEGAVGPLSQPIQLPPPPQTDNSSG